MIYSHYYEVLLPELLLMREDVHTWYVVLLL